MQVLRCNAWTSLVVVCCLSCHTACAILVPQSGIKPPFPASEGRFLTTGPPGKSPSIPNIFLCSNTLHVINLPLPSLPLPKVDVHSVSEHPCTWMPSSSHANFGTLLLSTTRRTSSLARPLPHLFLRAKIDFIRIYIFSVSNSTQSNLYLSLTGTFSTSSMPLP